MKGISDQSDRLPPASSPPPVASDFHSPLRYSQDHIQYNIIKSRTILSIKRIQEMVVPRQTARKFTAGGVRRQLALPNGFGPPMEDRPRSRTPTRPRLSRSPFQNRLERCVDRPPTPHPSLPSRPPTVPPPPSSITMRAASERSQRTLADRSVVFDDRHDSMEVLRLRNAVEHLSNIRRNRFRRNRAPRPRRHGRLHQQMISLAKGVYRLLQAIDSLMDIVRTLHLQRY